MWRNFPAYLCTVIFVGGCASARREGRDGSKATAEEPASSNPLALADYGPDFELRNRSQRPVNVVVDISSLSGNREVSIELGPGQKYDPAFWRWEQWVTQVRLSLAGEDPTVVSAPAGRRFDLTVERECVVARER